MKYTYEEFKDEAENAKIDVFLCSSSFEKRCKVIPEICSNMNLISSLVFYNENEVKEIVQNANQIRNMFVASSETVNLNSDDPIHNYLQIISSLDALIINHQKKLNFLIDITTFTHETLLILLKLLESKKALIGNVFSCYVGAKEYSTNHQKDEDKWLSKGVDEIRTILGYPGFTDPTKKNHLLILFGFELDRTKKIIEEYEYDYISLGFGDEPIADNHMAINVQRHKNLISTLPEARELTFSLKDPNLTKNQLLDYIEKSGLSGANTVIAPLNNKISTIGAGLAAMTNEKIQLAYAKATLYNVNGYSEPNGDIYFQEINFD